MTHKTISMVIVGNNNHELMNYAIEKTRQAVKCDKILVFSDYNDFPEDVIFNKLPEKFNITDYSIFLLKQLIQYVDTDYVLMIQYDGFAVNELTWTDEFLEYDYIGPPTHIRHPPLHQTLYECNMLNKFNKSWMVLGGGFSLRSRKLLEALNDVNISHTFFNYRHNSGWTCEDITICIEYKEYLEKVHGIKFAPVELALDFGLEVVRGYEHALGFHGYENIPIMLSEDECLYYFQKLENLKSKLDTNNYRFDILMGNLYQKKYYKVLQYFVDTL